MKITQLTISGFERSILISLYLEAFRLVLKVNSVPSLVMYWTENKKKIAQQLVLELISIKITITPN